MTELSADIVAGPDGPEALKLIEKAARICYQSQDKTTETSAAPLIRRLIQSGHMTPLEHVAVTVEFVLDRALHTEMVRHRLASPNVASTRYIKFGSEKFGGKVGFIQPDYKSVESVIEWLNHCAACVDLYNQQLERGEEPQMARGVLPLSLAVPMILTANIREWRHIFQLRAAKTAHPQLAKLMSNLLRQFQTKYPVLFDDIKGEVDA